MGWGDISCMTPSTCLEMLDTSPAMQTCVIRLLHSVTWDKLAPFPEGHQMGLRSGWGWPHWSFVLLSPRPPWALSSPHLHQISVLMTDRSVCLWIQNWWLARGLDCYKFAKDRFGQHQWDSSGFAPPGVFASMALPTSCGLSWSNCPPRDLPTSLNVGKLSVFLSLASACAFRPSPNARSNVDADATPAHNNLSKMHHKLQRLPLKSHVLGTTVTGHAETMNPRLALRMPSDIQNYCAAYAQGPEYLSFLCHLHAYISYKAYELDPGHYMTLLLT